MVSRLVGWVGTLHYTLPLHQQMYPTSITADVPNDEGWGLWMGGHGGEADINPQPLIL